MVRPTRTQVHRVSRKDDTENDKDVTAPLAAPRHKSKRKKGTKTRTTASLSTAAEDQISLCSPKIVVPSPFSSCDVHTAPHQPATAAAARTVKKKREKRKRPRSRKRFMQQHRVTTSKKFPKRDFARTVEGHSRQKTTTKKKAFILIVTTVICIQVPYGLVETEQ